MARKDVTIYDIAHKLNVSTSTVSRALQGSPLISKTTRDLVQSTARALGYHLNNFATNLRKQTTYTIGVMVHELNSSFITSVLSGIEKVTAAAGYDLIIAHSGEDHEKEAANALNLYHKRVDGLIASLSFTTKNLDHYRLFAEKGIPVIFFDRVEEEADIPRVTIDNCKCGYLATQHLIDQGCRRIVLVTASLKRNVYAQRHKGYMEALESNGIPFDKTLVLIKDLSEKSGIEAAMQILKMDPLPDGAFITNDFSAAVCVRTLQEHGIRIPQDIAVIGFNNDAVGKIVEPKLSTIDYPGTDMGEIAASTLVNHLRGGPRLNLTKTIVVRSALIIRESSLKKSPVPEIQTAS